MATKDFDYENFAQNLAAQAQELVPPEFNDVQKQYVINTLGNFALLSGKALAEDPNLNFNAEQSITITQIIAEWSFHKSVDVIRSGIPQQYWDQIMQKIAYTIFEIAKQMGISEGTVKWQLNDGRKRMRKELCAMNEKWNDTLVQKVMKKVEELKLWRLKNNKDGFEIVYKDVLKEVENLPESKGKYHALADVLHSGWWWLPGTKNDELFEKETYY